jgi:energy-coupling factor transport system ATP-binding protein
MPIEVDNLCYSYKMGTPFEKKVLHGISLRVADGEFVGLIGPTQSGKTTLAQHLNALIIPQSGKVTVNGYDTADKKADLISLRHSVGYVFQNPDHQLFAPTVAEDIAFGPLNQKLKKDEIAQRVSKAMKQVGLDWNTFHQRDIYALSGGQKRRVAIAGVLACQPQVLILDDVTAGLDPSGREEILAVIQRLHTENKITIIFISNSMDEVARLAERIIVLDRGKVVLDGNTRDIFSQFEMLRKIGLELPDLMEITCGLKQQGFNLAPAMLSLDEAVEAVYTSLKNRGVTI